MYHDARGELTRKLSLDGYFTDAETQVIGDPTYYIEVKTTTRGCEEPFFMSRAQYERVSIVPSQVCTGTGTKGLR